MRLSYRQRSANVEDRRGRHEEWDLLDQLVMSVARGVQLGAYTFSHLGGPTQLKGGPGPSSVDTSYQPPITQTGLGTNLRLPYPSEAVGTELVLEGGKLVTKIRFAPKDSEEAVLMRGFSDDMKGLRWNKGKLEAIPWDQQVMNR